MKRLISKVWNNEQVRYLFIGGCTTLVNLIVFYLLRSFTNADRNLSNLIAIISAIIFAYFTNKIFVFKSDTKGFIDTAREAGAFVAARLVAMAVELLGVVILCDSFRFNEFVAKLFVQVVVVVVNYIFSKLFVFKKEKKTLNEIFEENYCYIISALLALVVMIGVYLTEQIAPLGDHTLTIVDSMHQYLPFFSDYRDKILNGGSLFYSWNVALGSNFMSLGSYYFSSPFSLILLLFNKKYMVSGVCLLIVIKVCLSAFTMAYMLKNMELTKLVENSELDGIDAMESDIKTASGKKGRALNRKKKKELKNARFFTKNNIIIIAIAVSYALSNYVVGYFWNVMWLDCIMIFPLILLGFERLMEKGDYRMYVLSLCYCLFCNYYIGYIICVFLVLWFFVYRHKGVKAFFIGGLRFTIGSLLGGGLGAFLLLPAYYGIMSTASANTKLPAWEWYGSIFEMFKQQLMFTEPITNQTFDGGVNLYCGIIIIPAVLVYLMCKKVKPGDKVRRVILLAVLMISFNATTLNYIWHGMHDQYGIPNRFSFLFIMVVLLMAYEAILRIDEVKPFWVIASTVLSIGFVLLCYFKGSDVTMLMLISSLLMVLVYGLLMLAGTLKVFKPYKFRIIIGFVCIAEMLVSGIVGFNVSGCYEYKKNYKTTDNVEAANVAIDEMLEGADRGLVRRELVDSVVLDEATWHNMPSVGIFCSTVNGELVTTMGKLGFYTGANEFLYMGSTPFTNTLFNIGYLLEREEDFNNFDFDYVKTVEDVGIYENPYPLSIGFAASNQVKNWDRYAGLPLVNQNNLAFCITGMDGFFNMKYPTLNAESDNCDIEIEGNYIRYTPIDEGDTSIMASFFIPEDGDYYINCRGNYINKIRFFIDGEEITCDRYQVQIFHLGELKKDQYVNVEFIYKNMQMKAENASIFLATYDEDVYQQVYDRMSDNMLNVTEYADGYIKGNIDMPEDEILMTTIPYDKGWKVKVDGMITDYYAIGECFIGVDLEPGKHEIEMSYTPQGLYPGLIISAISLVIFMAIIISKNSKKDDGDSVENTNNDIDRTENI